MEKGKQERVREESLESENEERPVDGRGQVMERNKGVPIKSLHQDMVEIYCAFSGYVSPFCVCASPSPPLLLSSLSWEF